MASSPELYTGLIFQPALAGFFASVECQSI